MVDQEVVWVYLHHYQIKSWLQYRILQDWEDRECAHSKRDNTRNQYTLNECIYSVELKKKRLQRIRILILGNILC